MEITGRRWPENINLFFNIFSEYLLSIQSMPGIALVVGENNKQENMASVLLEHKVQMVRYLRNKLVNK